MKPRTQNYNTRHLTASSQRPPASASAPVRTPAAKTAPEPEPAATIADLRGQAEALGITVNRRWTPARLRLEIAAKRR
jgi:hypothetical protein